MGCFDGTCAFTRTAIRSGDPVLLVAIKRKVPLDTYNLMQKIKEYGRLKERGSADRYDNPFRFIGVGYYNDYGSIEEEFFNKDEGLIQGDNWWDYQFMVHLDVADGLLECHIKDVSNREEQVIKLIGLAWQLRVQLSGTALVGTQFLDWDEIEQQYRLQKLRLKVIQQQRRKLLGKE